MGIRFRQTLNELKHRMDNSHDKNKPDWLQELIDILIKEDEDLEQDDYERRMGEDM